MGKAVLSPVGEELKDSRSVENIVLEAKDTHGWGVQKYPVDGGNIAVVTMDDIPKYSLDKLAFNGLMTVLSTIDNEKDLRAALLVNPFESEGFNSVLCSGAALYELAAEMMWGKQTKDWTKVDGHIGVGQVGMTALQEAVKPWAAYMDGKMRGFYGGGKELGLSMARIYADGRAFLSFPELALELGPGWYGIQNGIARMEANDVDPMTAREVMMDIAVTRGKEYKGITGQESIDNGWGLVHRIDHEADAVEEFRRVGSEMVALKEDGYEPRSTSFSNPDNDVYQKYMPEGDLTDVKDPEAFIKLMAYFPGERDRKAESDLNRAWFVNVAKENVDAALAANMMSKSCSRKSQVDHLTRNPDNAEYVTQIEGLEDIKPEEYLQPAG